MSDVIDKFTYMPQYFSASICPRELKDQHWRGGPVCSNKNWRSIVTETNSNFIYLTYTSTVKAATDNISGDSIILIGEFYNFPDEDTIHYLLNKFQKNEHNFVSELNGSFAIIFIKKREDKVYVVTDRVNTRRIYYGVIDGVCCWLCAASAPERSIP